MHHGPLIAIIVAGLGLAFVFGAIAQRLRISPLVGYLVAGVAVGPFMPGFVADQGLANQLAEIGVILLMFGVGLHFSLKDLLSVKTIAVPGAVVQIGIATLLGLGLGTLLGWSPFSGAVFGLALSTASTVVLLRALQERRLVQTERGRIAVGWLIVEDIAMVLALVLLPVLAEVLNGTPSGGSAPLATRFDLGVLAMASEGLSGSEIEQAVIAGLYEAFDRGRPLEMADLLDVLQDTVPLSRMMDDQIEGLRAWARQRARPASSG